ncbi:cytochrome P450 [Irpex rosettiformis]|uniref:Cytochrome P450 n=1 Tax=Irpex rosettiformis TaxID=378272 RepID=A0ACB8U271_9APHY|nr:cytochrome P450 [Irpex rosettiformis]
MSWLLLTVSVPTLLWAVLKLYQHVIRIHDLSDLPGPPVASYIWGDIFNLKKAPAGTLWREWTKKYGPTFIIHEGLMKPMLILGDAKGATHVLNNTSIYWKPEIDRSILSLWFGESMLSAEGQIHAERRRRLNPAFNSQSIKQIAPILFDLAFRLEANWTDRLGSAKSVVVDVSGALQGYALDAVSMTMFAHCISTSEGPNSVKEMFKNLSEGPPSEDTIVNRLARVIVSMYPRLLAILPSPMKTWATTLRAELGKIATEVWDVGKLNEDVGGMDARILEVLSQQKKDGAKISKDDAVAEIVGLLFVGSETVANVIGEFLHELAHHPRIQQTLRQEFVDFEAQHGFPPSFNDLMASGNERLKYLDAVMMESLRCKMPVMDVQRVPIVEDIIPLSTPIPGRNGNFLRVQPGQIISIPLRDGINFDPRIWGEDVEEFRPERWLEPGTSERGPGLGGLLTFGDGPKTCIGRGFALAEFKIVVSTLVRNFYIYPSEDEPDIDFYHLGSNAVKPKVRGKEKEGVKLPLRIQRV